jgi:hypothetical protein
MATEPNLRDLFRSSDDAPARAIDTQAVIRRSKARRLPAQIGIGGVFTLAVGGLGFAGIQAIGGSGQSASDSSAVSSAEDAPESGIETFGGVQDSESSTGAIKRAPADRINLCGGALAEVAPSETGLVLTVAFPDAAVGTETVTGTVTLTNTGATAVSGYTSPSPAVTLSQNGIVLWHSNGPTIMMIQDVNLAPGQSMEFATSFSPVVCTVDDDLAEAFRTDLPAAPAGEYQLSAAADVTIGDTAELVTGPAQTVRIG